MLDQKEDRLFEASKIDCLLAEELDCMGAGERQILLVMAETKIAEGYKPTAREKLVIEKLRALAGQDYDAKDIRRKVRKMVKGPSKQDSPRLSLPPAFDHLLQRLRAPKSDD